MWAVRGLLVSVLSSGSSGIEHLCSCSTRQHGCQIAFSGCRVRIESRVIRWRSKGTAGLQLDIEIRELTATV